MLNFDDVQKLRQQGQTNRQILEMMAPVVPTARNLLQQVDADTATPKWQVESRLGDMIDRAVPKNAPSGIGYLTAVNLNKAEETYQLSNQKYEQKVQQPQHGLGFMDNFNKIVGGIQENNTAYQEGRQGFTDTVLQDAAGFFNAGLLPASTAVGAVNNYVVKPVLSGAKQIADQTGATDAFMNSPYGQYSKTALQAGQSLVNPVVDKVTNYVNDQAAQKPEVAASLKTFKDVAGSLGNAAGIYGANQLEKAAWDGTPKLMQAIKNRVTSADKPLQEIVTQGMEKAIKPRFAGDMRTKATSLQEYNTKATHAVQSILDHKDKLQYVDDTGEIASAAHVPTNLKEFAQAIDQTKKQIFSEYSALTKEATGKGAMVKVDPIVEKLLNYAEDPAIVRASPDKAQYAIKVAENLMKHGDMSPDVAENVIKEMNSRLLNFYGSQASKGIADVDATIASEIRNALDEVVTGSTDGNYQELKNAYGALKAIEKDVGHRALVTARQSIKDLPSYSDIFSGGDITYGVLSGNPALIAKGAAQKAILSWYKHLNSPDTNIMKMFRAASKVYQPAMDSALMDVPLSQLSPQGMADANAAKEVLKAGGSVDEAAKISGSSLSANLKNAQSEISNLNEFVAQAKEELQVKESLLNDMPNLQKYANKKTGELPEVLGKGKSQFARTGDNMATGLGFSDSEGLRQAQSARDALNEEVKALKQSIIDSENELRNLQKSIKTPGGLRSMQKRNSSSNIPF